MEQVLPKLIELNKAEQAVSLLMELIRIPSYSKEEHGTADLLVAFFHERGIPTKRHLNNVWVQNKFFDQRKKTILLNSHHDTVKPNKNSSRDPFQAIISEGKLYGLGSNDAGASLVSLIMSFLHFYERNDLQYNLIFAASAEEEISGKDGIESLLPLLGKIEFGIVGEPTQMQMAIAERGLIVLDCYTQGTAGHAAREEGENALYKAMKSIEWFRSYSFEKVSELLGPVKMNVTVIETENKAHNVVPSSCHFVVDVRVNELYSLEEVVNIISKNTSCEVKPRSFRMRSSFIAPEHPLIMAGTKLGLTNYGSPTSSDKALMNFLCLKIGPGDSARSHSADEFIYLKEIEEGIEKYINILKSIL